MTSGKPMRADARRSYERLLAAAAEVFEAQIIELGAPKDGERSGSTGSRGAAAA